MAHGPWRLLRARDKEEEWNDSVPGCHQQAIVHRPIAPAACCSAQPAQPARAEPHLCIATWQPAGSYCFYCWRAACVLGCRVAKREAYPPVLNPSAHGRARRSRSRNGAGTERRCAVRRAQPRIGAAAPTPPRSRRVSATPRVGAPPPSIPVPHACKCLAPQRASHPSMCCSLAARYLSHSAGPTIPRSGTRSVHGPPTERAPRRAGAWILCRLRISDSARRRQTWANATRQRSARFTHYALNPTQPPGQLSLQSCFLHFLGATERTAVHVSLRGTGLSLGTLDGWERA